MNDLRYLSDTITLKQIIQEEIFFKIPIYQRLYVWEKEQIHTLLSDIVSSFKQKKSEDSPVLYLGNVIVQENRRNDKTVYELIDGQQRFTTLWLLSIYLDRELKAYAFPTANSKGNGEEKPLRIEFDIREQVTEFMREIINHYNDGGEKLEFDLDLMVQKQPEKGFDTGTLEPLADAFKEIKTFFNNYLDEEFDGENFANYILNRVQLVRTIVPDTADLNKLFEVLNNRGMQLELHQILKARMLELCNKGGETLEYETEHYAILWDSCSDMNEFIEKGFQDASGKRLTELKSYDKETKKTITQYKGTGGAGHDRNFIEAIREGDRDLLNCEIGIGHMSTTMCHMANIAWRMGNEANVEQVSESVKQHEDAVNTLESMLAQLDRNDIDLKQWPFILGPKLEYDLKSEKFTGEHGDKANELVRLPCREPFVVPEEV